MHLKAVLLTVVSLTDWATLFGFVRRFRVIEFAFGLQAKARSS
jgi:hypothetical protein